jgi:hypothetical protein
MRAGGGDGGDSARGREFAYRRPTSVRPRAGGREPAQVGVHGEHVARAADAAERYHRVQRAAVGGRRGPGRRAARARPAEDRHCRPTPTLPHQRCARHSPQTSTLARPGGSVRRPDSRPARAAAGPTCVARRMGRELERQLGLASAAARRSSARSLVEDGARDGPEPRRGHPLPAAPQSDAARGVRLDSRRARAMAHTAGAT